MAVKWLEEEETKDKTKVDFKVKSIYCCTCPKCKAFVQVDSNIICPNCGEFLLNEIIDNVQDVNSNYIIIYNNNNKMVTTACTEDVKLDNLGANVMCGNVCEEFYEHINADIHDDTPPNSLNGGKLISDLSELDQQIIIGVLDSNVNKEFIPTVDKSSKDDSQITFDELNENKKQLNENTNVDAPIRAWIANLGKYNEGELVGAWVDFPIDEDELQRILKDKVGLNDQYEEYAIFDWESDYMEYPGEYVNLDTINEWAEYIDSLQSWELDTLEAAKEAGYVDNILDFNPNDYVLLDADDEQDLGYLLVDSMGGVENLAPETIEQYFDYEELGRELDFDLWGDEEMSAAEFWCGREEASDRDIGEAFVDDVGIEGVRNPENYFDYTEYGRDWSQFDGEFTSKGFIYKA